MFLLLEYLVVVFCILISVAFLTLLERKMMSTIQRRKGPSLVGFFGVLQAIADGVKLLLKESLLPLRSNNFLFVVAPQLSLLLAITSWSVIPFLNFSFCDFDLSILFILVLSSINVYSIILAGWSSNSKYSFLGSIRSAAQMISYEITIGTVVLILILLNGSFNFKEIVYFQFLYGWNIWALLPVFLIFFISILAETNRTPFDLPEAEAELVSGYNVEYAAVGFAFFFIAEYSNIILMSFLCVVFFFGSLNFFYYFFLTLFFIFSIIFARIILPRFRYDQLMVFGWKVLIPISFSFFIYYFTFFIFFSIV